MINAKLVVVGGTTTKEIRLELPATFGRGRETTVTLPHPLVSRRHCEVYESDGRLMVRDLGSTNGTFVGSERITESVLAPGELLTIGTVTFRAVYGEFELMSGPPVVSEVADREAAAADTEKLVSPSTARTSCTTDPGTTMHRLDAASQTESRRVGRDAGNARDIKKDPHQDVFPRR
jgi:pSer/pThr/pTyr-binding forkhead associated (FHA) protein